MVLQTSDGRLSWAGTPFASAANFPFSFTYHHYTLIDLYDYYIYIGDRAYVQRYWAQYKYALQWSLSQIDASVSQTSPALTTGCALGWMDITAR